MTEKVPVKIQDKPKDRGIDIEVSKIEEKKIEKETEVPKKVKDKIVEKPEVKKEKSVARPQESLNLPNLSQDQMAKGLDSLKNMSPDAINQMASTLKNMDPRLMQSVFKSQGIDMPPEEIAKMADMLTPETVNMMTSSLGRNQTTGETSNLPPQAPDISSMLNNPALTRMASEMLGKQLGKKPEDIQTLLNFFGKLMSFFMKIASIYQFFTRGNRKYFTGAVTVLIIANYFGMLGA